MTSALEPSSPNTNACPIGVVLLSAATTRTPTYPSMMPATEARCELPRIHLLGNRVNKGKKSKGRGS